MDASSEEESKLFCVKFLRHFLEFASEQEGEDDLVLLEERTTDVTIKRDQELLVQEVKTFLQILTGLRVLNGSDEEIDKEGEGVLIHGIDVCEIGDTKEQTGSSLCDWSVAHTHLIDFLLSLFSNLLLLGDIVGKNLCIRQDFNSLGVAEDVGGG